MNMLQENNWLLSLGTFLPMVGVVLLMLMPKAQDKSVKLVALFTSIATLAVGIYTAFRFDFDQAEKMQFVANETWIAVIKSSYFIGVDGISLPLYLLSMVITLLVVIYSLDHVPSPGKPKAFFSLLLVLQTGMAGTFIAQDLILFFVFFELVLLPMFFMIGVWGGEQRQYASIKFFLYTMFGSALMLVAFLALFFKTGAESFSIPYLIENGGSIGKNIQIWIFAGMFVGFAVKVPMFPFHTWLPDAHTQAPTQGSVILAAILLKLGTYGFVRIALPILPTAAREWAPYIGGLAVIGIIYGAIAATMQRDLKRLVAYSSVAHLGFIVLGTFALSSQAVTGAVMQMVNHGVSTGALFLLVGMIYERRHTREIAELRGLQHVAPIFAGVFTVVMLSSVGLPGLNGFVGEFLILIGSFGPARWWTVVATVGVVLAALYLLWAYQRVFHGEPDEANSSFKELTLREGLLMSVFLAIIVVSGIYPKPILDRIEPSVVALIEHVEGQTK
ncbi:MAG: NADH-quinone oxidoreductase subunit [Actinomycetota bacterium]